MKLRVSYQTGAEGLRGIGTHWWLLVRYFRMVWYYQPSVIFSKEGFAKLRKLTPRPFLVVGQVFFTGH